MKVNTTNKLPVKLWMEKETDLESGAWDQVTNLANYPFAFKHIAIMPDAHQGYGMPIGGVMATQEVIIPNAVGVDIGCGMCAVKTTLKELDIETLKKIMGRIRESVPVGFSKHKYEQSEEFMPIVPIEITVQDYVVGKEYNNALKSLGTLGGGNHFIEIQKGSDGFIWIMIHSGSRNLGFKTANHYNKTAIELNEKYKSSVPKKHELAFLPLDSKEGQGYIKEMNYCVDFALANRRLMMERVIQAVADNTNQTGFDDMINIAHNYASIENHFGKNVWVHRKGATKATDKTVGIIPGSQGTKSYIVKGKGNKESFESCSHGAGRKMGRSHAREILNLEEEQKKLEGVIHSIRGVKDLDEASGAYKPIETVMANQTDLVDVLVELTPLAVIKG